MKNSISKRITLITFGLISIVFLLTFLFQNMFFEEFYLSKKTESLILDVKRIKTLYSYQNFNTNNLSNALLNYEEKNNSRIAIFSLDGSIEYLSYFDKNNIEDMKSLTDFCSELLSDNELIQEVLSTNKIQSTIFTNKYSTYKKIGIISSMSLQSENDSILISVSSVQPIKEAASVIRSFYLYLFIGFLILAIFLSKIYSKLISKPLINLNNVAKRMSTLDFDAKCEVNSDDEIGNLANTLNFLSSNLENSLQTLQEKNNQLERDIEKERNLENMRKDFVSSVSHDLKTPLGIISGYAEGLKDGIVSGKDAEVYLETIIDEATKMNLLLTNMLDLSKLESDTINLNLESFNIVRLLQGMVKRFSLELQNKELTITFNLPEYAYVEGDIMTLERVVQNLLSNAIKYTPRGNEIIISVIESETLYLISFENKGITIPTNELDNVFAKFYRLDKSGDRTKNSYGLGLATVKRILTLHNSNFSLNNGENSVIFTFTLKKQDLIISDDFE
ncbi:MAG: HAMP domain-containing sensor histidine kinase [Clostridium sp.]|nr:HAMP domain-containing sensor histidine kinase [Clostridium sp.]